MLTIEHIAAALSNYVPIGGGSPISFVTNDSRQVAKDSLFVAFFGEHVDGHAYVAKAFAQGAVAALVERPVGDYAIVDVREDVTGMLPEQRPLLIWVADSTEALQQCARYWRQQHTARVIGITGSVGKTSTKEAVFTVLQEQFCTLKSEKNFNTEIGLPMQLLNLRSKHERVILEMGMFVRGDIALLASVAQPNVAVVTNVGEVHVERAGSQAAIAEGKRELVEALASDGIAILNGDDPLVSAMREHTQAQVFTIGTSAEFDLYATNIISRGFAGISFTLNYAGESHLIHSPMRGLHNVYTALCAAAVGLVEGMAWEAIVRGLEKHEDRLRLVIRDGINESIVIDDAYNSNPQSAAAALDLLADVTGRKLAVLGDMLELGAHEANGHERIGRKAAQIANQLVLVGKLGRLIGEAAIAAGFSSEDCVFVADSNEAVAMIAGLIRPKDTTLIKGSLGANMKIIVEAITSKPTI